MMSQPGGQAIRRTMMLKPQPGIFLIFTACALGACSNNACVTTNGLTPSIQLADGTLIRASGLPSFESSEKTRTITVSRARSLGDIKTIWTRNLTVVRDDQRIDHIDFSMIESRRLIIVTWGNRDKYVMFDIDTGAVLSRSLGKGDDPAAHLQVHYSTGQR